ncbi:PCI-domain protein (macronuclear) [Tetrahymena thermophila SB210]|uniref:PCI-domain protein n=1 Tax=Tetrahymena thermophila (strain SB210) TaxID=312017 RepID=Q23JZ9_TETTS|nr:PCI-domain protein [Tetrahymena thermophila SB210]EAR97044.1 PCI-domain protein [Tetrahymena thermophila SB210]|eukprot:XP_001017289.1 PCI-domain protein [Tetrahymena thermophila SB210]
MSYQLIKLTELDNLDRLAAHIEQALTKASKFDEEEEKYLEEFKQKSSQYLKSQSYEALIELLFQAKKNLKLDQKYLNSISAITSYLITASPKQEATLKKYQTVLEAEESHASNVLIQYGIVFNGLDSLPKIQYSLLLYIIAYSKKNDKIGVLNTTFTDIDTITKNWNLTNNEKKKLLSHIVDALDKSIKQDFRCQIVLKYFQSFEFQDKQDDETLKKYIHLLLNYGQVLSEYGSIFETNGLKHLQKSNPVLFQIFSFFITGDVKGFEDFKKSNPNGLKDNNIVEEEYLEKVRVQSISRFAKSGELISYQQFAQNLHINIEDVENWVILAITSKIIDAQIDQYNQIIYVKANYGKYLDKKEWISMNDQLKVIMEKIKSYLESADKLA